MVAQVCDYDIAIRGTAVG